MKVVDYLDVTMNLNNGTYRPYHKPNSDIMYIHSESNHPPAVIKQLPLSIESRLRTISSSKEIFDEASKTYQSALERSGYNHVLAYENDTINNLSGAKSRKRNRKRNIIWFNPPYSKSVATNVGRYFLVLLEKHFPNSHKFRKIFNRNTVKVSYSCMPNIKARINQHNKKILQKHSRTARNDEPVNTCNCPRNTECPLENNCLDKNMIYSAEISSNLPNYESKVYKGICSTTFKARLGNHKKSFNNERYEADSTLSKEVWRIKRNGGNFTIKWKKEASHRSYQPEGKSCLLCKNEKLVIALHDDKDLLNKRSEIISRCRHRCKYKLKNLVF